MINECYKRREQNEDGERCKLREDKEIMEQNRVEWGKEDEKIKEQKKKRIKEQKNRGEETRGVNRRREENKTKDEIKKEMDNDRNK